MKAIRYLLLCAIFIIPAACEKVKKVNVGVTGVVNIINRDGTLSAGSGAIVSSSPALYDLDGDGNLEVVFGSWDNKVYAIKTNNPVPSSDLIPWPEFKHDFKNTGLFTGGPNPPW